MIPIQRSSKAIEKGDTWHNFGTPHHGWNQLTLERTYNPFVWSCALTQCESILNDERGGLRWSFDNKIVWFVIQSPFQAKLAIFKI